MVILGIHVNFQGCSHEDFKLFTLNSVRFPAWPMKFLIWFPEISQLSSWDFHVHLSSGTIILILLYVHIYMFISTYFVSFFSSRFLYLQIRLEVCGKKMSQESGLKAENWETGWAAEYSRLLPTVTQQYDTQYDGVQLTKANLNSGNKHIKKNTCILTNNHKILYNSNYGLIILLYIILLWILSNSHYVFIAYEHQVEIK